MGSISSYEIRRSDPGWIIDSIYSKVLIIEDDEGNDVEAMNEVERVKEFVAEYRENAAIHDVKKLENAHYRVALIFRDKKTMEEWQQTFGIQNYK